MRLFRSVLRQTSCAPNRSSSVPRLLCNRLFSNGAALMSVSRYNFPVDVHPSGRIDEPGFWASDAAPNSGPSSPKPPTLFTLESDTSPTAVERRPATDCGSSSQLAKPMTWERILPRSSEIPRVVRRGSRPPDVSDDLYIKCRNQTPKRGSCRVYTIFWTCATP